jgi:hypothetical protein
MPTPPILPLDPYQPPAIAETSNVVVGGEGKVTPKAPRHVLLECLSAPAKELFAPTLEFVINCSQTNAPRAADDPCRVHVWIGDLAPQTCHICQVPELVAVLLFDSISLVPQHVGFVLQRISACFLERSRDLVFEVQTPGAHGTSSQGSPALTLGWLDGPLLWLLIKFGPRG